MVNVNFVFVVLVSVFELVLQGMNCAIFVCTEETKVIWVKVFEWRYNREYRYDCVKWNGIIKINMYAIHTNTIICQNIFD